MRGLSPPDVRFGIHNKIAGERTRRFARATARAYCVSRREGHGEYEQGRYSKGNIYYEGGGAKG